MSKEPFEGKIHVSLGGPDCAATVCGLDPKKVKTVGPKLAQHATCKNCIRSLVPDYMRRARGRSRWA